MRIYLLRHGIAIDRDAPDCPPDPQRALTDKGWRRTRAAARGLAALDVAPDRVFTSPYLRAQQTAEIAIEELSVPGERLVVTETLLDDEPEPLCALLREYDPDVALVVGHAPSLDILAGFLIGSGPVTQLKKAGVACLDADEIAACGGELVALYPPRTLRRLGKGAGPQLH